MWCLVLDNVTCEIHPEVRVDVGAGTVGQFTTYCLAENGRIITITGQLSINGSVQFLGIPDFSRDSGFSFIENLQAPTIPTSWKHINTSNHNWGVILWGTYIMCSVPWDSTVPARPTYMPKIPENLPAAALCVYDDFLHRRHRESMRSLTTSHNPTVNPDPLS